MDNMRSFINLVESLSTPDWMKSEESIVEKILGHPGYINDLLDHNVAPSPQVQRIVLEKTDWAIHALLDAGIIPDEQCQIISVRKNRHVLRDLLDERVMPSESVQIAAMIGKTDIEVLLSAGITPSEKVINASYEYSGYSTIRMLIEYNVPIPVPIQILVAKRNAILFMKDVIRFGVKLSIMVQMHIAKTLVEKRRLPIDFTSKELESIFDSRVIDYIVKNGIIFKT